MKEKEFDFGKREEYKQAEKNIPSLESYYILNKIKLIDSLMDIPGVEKINIQASYDIEDYSINGDSLDYQANVMINYDYTLSLNEKDNNESTQREIDAKLSQIKKLDKEIAEFIGEACLEMNESEAIEHAENSLYKLFFVGEKETNALTKNNCYDIYKEYGGDGFNKDTLSHFHDFIDSLSDKKEYCSHISNAYHIDFHILPLSSKQWEETYDVFKNKRFFELYYHINLVRDFVITIQSDPLYNKEDLFVMLFKKEKSGEEVFQIKKEEEDKGYWPYATSSGFLKTSLTDLPEFFNKVSEVLCHKYLVRNQENYHQIYKELGALAYSDFEKKIINNSVSESEPDSVMKRRI